MQIPFNICAIVILLLSLLLSSCGQSNEATQQIQDQTINKTIMKLKWSQASGDWKKAIIPFGSRADTITFGVDRFAVISGRGTMLISHDGGETWRELNGGQGSYLSTIDGGGTYHDTDNQGRPFPSSINVKDLCNVEGAIITSSGRLYLRTVCEHTTQIWSVPIKDESEAWHVVSFTYEGDPSSGVYTPDTKFVLSGDRIFIAAVQPNGSALMTTDDDGATWHAFWHNSYSEAGIVDFDFIDESQGLVLLSNGILLGTVDKGRNWERVSSLPREWAESAYSLDFADARNGFIVGSGGMILASNDGGGTWQPQDSGAKFKLYKVATSDSKRAWAVGGSNTVLETFDGGRHWHKIELNIERNIYFSLAIKDKAAWIVSNQFIFRSS